MISNHDATIIDDPRNTVTVSPANPNQITVQLGQAFKSGSNLLTGTVDPVDAVGTEGDFYINSATKFVHGPKGSVSWPSLALIAPEDVENVKNHGALGNAIADDTAAIQAAIDAVSTNAGGVVYFPPGTYLTDGVTVNFDGVRLMGAGYASRLRQFTASGAQDLVTFLNCDYCGMRDMWLDGSWQGTRGVVLEGCRWSTFDCLIGDRFSGPMIDLRADGAATQNTNNNTFQHIHATNATRFIRMQGDASNYVTLNEFSSISAVGAGTAASILIDFVKGADTNVFLGLVRLNLNFGSGDIGVIFNSGDPSNTNDVYGNHFLGELAIDQDAASTVSVRVNNTNTAGSGPWPNRIGHLRLGGTNPTAIDLNGGINAHVAQVDALGAFDDVNRPTAADQIPGAMIWNVDDGFPNWADGANWVDATGSVT